MNFSLLKCVCLMVVGLVALAAAHPGDGYNGGSYGGNGYGNHGGGGWNNHGGGGWNNHGGGGYNNHGGNHHHGGYGR
ncbi:uncharacterized protein [Bemisia tabaci]|uniref:uncharacterized protein isoform X1 n=1 Tax=Bemisia tabaci TaxID=7038 RepID=UPI003B28B744